VFEKLIIQKTLRVPASTGAAGDGTPVARQLDAALLDVGFSASRALLEHVGTLAAGPALDLATTVVSSWRATTSSTTPTSSAFRTTCPTPSSSGRTGYGRPYSPAAERRPTPNCGTRSLRAR
jgi:hypothetical protein